MTPAHARSLEFNDMRRNLLIISLWVASVTLLTSTPAAYAQPATSSQPQGARQAADTRPATATAAGDTGLWFVPTAEVLPNKKWSASFYRANADFGQGFTDVSHFPVTFAFGIADRAELFGSWTAMTRIDRDTRPVFFTSPAGGPANAGGGVVNEYPLVRQYWSGNARGDLRAGIKINLLSQADQQPMALALRAGLKAGIGDEETGASTGKTDYTLDLIASSEFRAVELSAFGGYIKRGDPDGFDLTDGIRWGLGAGFPSRAGLRVTTELHGEFYRDGQILAPAGFTAIDGSIAPLSTSLSNPIYATLGLTWQTKGGFFIGGGVNWSGSVGARENAICVAAVCAAFGNNSGDSIGFQGRIGFHPGVRKYTAPVVVPPAPAPVAVAPPAPVNRPPVVHASCDPCTVEAGKVATVAAAASDPDGDTLAYRWTVATGSLTSATAAQTPWTAPMQAGAVPFTVTVTDPAGLSASANVTIQVVQPPVKEYVFEDVHFDFDRNNLRPDALRVLDEAIEGLKANPALTLLIEGHTCNIGTPEYNMALADRRAQSVRDYLHSRGVSPDRLRTVSYGEERPKHDNDREETRRLNRRAALVVSVVR